MTRPDEIAALADRLHAASCALLRGDDAVEHVPAICDAEQALRLSATSPGDAVRVKPLEWKRVPAGPVTSERYEAKCVEGVYRIFLRDAGGIEWTLNGFAPTRHTATLESAKRAAQLEHEHNVRAALAPAEKAGDEYVALVPDHSDRIVWRGNYYNLPLSTTPTPPSADVDAGAKYLCETVFNYKWDGVREGRAFDHGVKPWVRANARKDDYRDAARAIQSAAHGGGTEGGLSRASSIPPVQEAVPEVYIASLIRGRDGLVFALDRARALLSTFNITRKP
jgi:hypothetical protein